MPTMHLPTEPRRGIRLPERPGVARGLLLAFLIVAQDGCRESCLAPRDEAAVQAVWRADVPGLRELLRADPGLATRTGCSQPRSLTARIISRYVIREAPPTLLHVAARQGYTEVALLLLAHGAAVNARGPLADSPLHIAARYGHAAVAEALIENGADLAAQRNGRLTPLHVAAGYGHAEVVELLLARGVDVNAREDDGWTPLHRAVAGGLRRSASGSNASVVRLLLDRGADVAARDAQGAPPLHYAVLDRDTSVIELLLDHGADVNAASLSTTPLTVAVTNGNAETVELLIRRGASVDTRDENGDAPVLLAIRRPGASADGDQDAVRTLRLLLEAGADPGASGGDGSTPLHRAAAYGRTDLAQLLLHHRAAVDVRDRWRRTPLHVAAGSHEAAAADLLLRHGADPNARDESNETPLAQAWGDEAMKALLRRHGARES